MTDKPDNPPAFPVPDVVAKVPIFSGVKSSLTTQARLMPLEVTEEMAAAFFKAKARYSSDELKDIYPRPSLADYVYEAFLASAPRPICKDCLQVEKQSFTTQPAFECPIKHPGCVKNCGNYGCGN